LANPDHQRGNAEPHQYGAKQRNPNSKEHFGRIVRLIWHGFGWPYRYWRRGEHIRRTANFTVLLALGTLALALVNLGMLIEMRHGGDRQHEDTLAALGKTDATIAAMQGQSEIMRGQLNEMEIARRPWVTADFGIAGPLEMQDGALTTTLGIILRNTGQTPAVRTQIAIDLFPVQAFDPYNSVHTVCMQVDRALSHNNAIGPNVFPNERKPTLTYTISIYREKMEEYYKRVPVYQNIAIMPFVALCIGYKECGWDTFHHTSFILRYTTKEPIRDVKWEEMPINASDLDLHIFHAGNLPPD